MSESSRSFTPESAVRAPEWWRDLALGFHCSVAFVWALSDALQGGGFRSHLSAEILIKGLTVNTWSLAKPLLMMVLLPMVIGLADAFHYEFHWFAHIQQECIPNGIPVTERHVTTKYISSDHSGKVHRILRTSLSQMWLCQDFSCGVRWRFCLH